MVVPRHERWMKYRRKQVCFPVLFLATLFHCQFLHVVVPDLQATSRLLFFGQDEMESIDPEIERELLVDCRSVAVDTMYNTENITWVRTATRPSFSMHVHPFQDDAVSAAIGKTGCYECDLLPHTIYALKSRSDSIFVDVGANIGLYSLAAAAAGFDVVAFEPVRLSYQKVCESVLANPGFRDRVKIVKRAISNESGIVRFNMWQGNFAGISTTRASQETTASMEEGVHFGFSTALDTVAQYILPIHRPIVLKVDIEGEECNALAGALNYLRQVEILYAQVEFNPSRSGMRCRNMQAISDFFTSKGLKPYMMFNGQRALNPDHADLWQSPKRGGNFDVGWFPGDER